MLMMFKDILRTLIFTLVPGLIFAFLVMSALPTFKNSGFKNTIKGFFKSLKNKDRLFLFLLLIYFFIVYTELFFKEISATIHLVMFLADGKFLKHNTQGLTIRL